MKKKCLSMDQVGKADALYIVLPLALITLGTLNKEEPLLAFYWAGHSWKGNQIGTNCTGHHVS